MASAECLFLPADDHFWPSEDLFTFELHSHKRSVTHLDMADLGPASKRCRVDSPGFFLADSVEFSDVPGSLGDPDALLNTFEGFSVSTATDMDREVASFAADIELDSYDEVHVVRDSPCREGNALQTFDVKDHQDSESSLLLNSYESEATSPLGHTATLLSTYEQTARLLNDNLISQLQSTSASDVLQAALSLHRELSILERELFQEASSKVLPVFALCQHINLSEQLRKLKLLLQANTSLLRKLQPIQSTGAPIALAHLLDASCASLIIEEQPEGVTLMKNQHVPFSFKLRIVCNSLIEVTALGPITATVHSSADKTVRVANNTEPVNGDLTATFSNLIFQDGSWQKLAHLQFQVEVKLGIRGLPQSEVTAVLCSEFSSPLVVMVHQTQWAESEKQLLLEYALRNPLSPAPSQCSLPFLCNTLRKRIRSITYSQDCFLTEEDNIPFVVPFSREEVEEVVYYHMLLRMKQAINEEDISSLWSSLGAYISSVRDPRRNFRLWRDGIIVGFMSDRKAEDVLFTHGVPGSALIRFSADAQGMLTVSRRSRKRDVVKHVHLSETESRRKACMSVLKKKSATDFVVARRCVTGSEREYMRMSKMQLQNTYISRSRRVSLN